MPVTDLGAGATTSRTQRFVHATDDPIVKAAGGPTNDQASASLTEDTEIALLKSLVTDQRNMVALLSLMALELKRLRYGLSFALKEDLEKAIPR